MRKARVASMCQLQVIFSLTCDWAITEKRSTGSPKQLKNRIGSRCNSESIRFLDPLRSDPRFGEILAGFMPKDFEVAHC